MTIPGKSCFDDVYDQRDPRPYFRRLAPLEYRIPHHAQEVFRRVHAQRTSLNGAHGPVAVLDLCCSYGINAALLNHHLTLDELYAHYTAPEVQECTTEELIAGDREFYAARRRADAVPVLGLDASSHAIRYAREVGLVTDGFAENLEAAEPSPRLRQALADTGLITVTGGVGYITQRTFGALLAHVRSPVWVAAFVLRAVPYEPIAACLAEYGLITERDATRTYPQRLFTDPAEQRSALRAVQAVGEDPAGKEADGYYHTNLYLSRRD
ncbi:hypothetical protein ACFP1Z_11030 [Streptomyces gamaensis]|uniref:Methyltransferase type 12 n=1 Tax=Streptomyces gamaensis TaxID=1763542 RepID=A0ABW0YVU7_9ACTN